MVVDSMIRDVVVLEADIADFRRDKSEKTSRQVEGVPSRV